MNTPQNKFNEVALDFATSTPAVGISTILGEAKRGPIGPQSGKDIFTSYDAFRKVHGGLIAGKTDPLIVKRATERGSAIRFINIRHYSDLDAGTLDAVVASAAASSLVALDADLGAAHTITVNVNGSDSIQAFSVSSANTLDLLIAKIKLLSGIVQDAFRLTNRSIIIVPKAGVALVTTADVTGAGAPNETVTTEATYEDTAGNALFTLVPKYAGADYNNILTQVLPASNGDPDAFDIAINHLVETDLSELHQNLKIIGKPTVVQSTYLKKITDTSKFLKPVYNDLSGIAGAQLVLRKWALRYQSGTDGSATIDADYIGSSVSKTGLYAMDGISDMSQFTIPNKSTVGILQAGAAYASNRKDVQFFGFLGNFTTEALAATARDNSLVDTKYCQLYAQNITVQNPLDSQPIDISPMGDIIGCADYSDGNFFPWYSFAGKKRGQILNASAVPNNFGAQGNIPNLNMLANRQVNVVVNDNGKIFIKSNYTAQKEENGFSFGSITRFIIFLKKNLGPVIELYLEEPNDIPTWKRMYLAVQPTLNTYGKNRALHGEENEGWVWYGDQFANTMDDLKINVAADVEQGKYRVRLFLKTVKPLIELTVDIVLSPSGVSFEDVLTNIISQ